MAEDGKTDDAAQRKNAIAGKKSDFRALIQAFSLPLPPKLKDSHVYNSEIL